MIEPTEPNIRVLIATCGETKEDKQGECPSSYRGILSFKGKLAAENIAVYLLGQKVDQIICANQQTAKDNLKIMQEIWKIYNPKYKPEVLSFSSLNDLKYGVCETMKKEVFLKSLLKSKAPFRDFQPKGGENLNSLRKRIRDFFLRLACVHLWEKKDPWLKTGKSTFF